MDNRDFNLYKIFLTLYDLKSISKTANKLYVSQPAISYSLKELESQLGYSLFYRNSKGIVPTIEAIELYSYISEAFNIIKSGEEHIKKMNTLDVGEIKIGAPTYISVFYLSSFISYFRKKYPGIKFEIITKSSKDDLANMLHNRSINLIVDTLPISINNKSCKELYLSTINNCFVYKKNSKSKVKSIKDLEKYPLILPIKGSTNRVKLEEYMEKRNVKLKSIIECNSLEFMLEMVRKDSGIGYFIESAITSQIDKDNFEIIDFDNTLPKIDIYAIYLDDFKSPVLTKFLELLSKNK